MNAGDVFLKAIDVLAERGWIQGDFEDPADDGIAPAVCILGACGVAINGDPYEAAYIEMESLIKRLLIAIDSKANAVTMAKYVDVVAGWNDSERRTYEDVVLALKRAAAGEAAPCA